ncbi:hypothetical protein O181_030437 [Austropuccinia psidii MF-1]|uniref:Uncharacterized protein n=1 Tax=Austropuccinia psidii MF-1 TaxID=1389203 RepID=A0A9Q3H4F6_9BASI|nr:hypothetical protein [Austropuccinia psidii MF-1]
MRPTRQRRAVWSPDENIPSVFGKPSGCGFKPKSEPNKEYKRLVQSTSQHSEVKNTSLPLGEMVLRTFSPNFRIKRDLYLPKREIPILLLNSYIVQLSTAVILLEINHVIPNLSAF